MDDRIVSASGDDADRAIERAAAALRQGRVVALALETGFVCLARAGSDALAALAADNDDEGETLNGAIAALLAESASALIALTPPRRLAHRLLFRRLAPGPVVFEVEAARVAADIESAAWRAGGWARLRASAAHEARLLLRALEGERIVAVEPAHARHDQPALASAAEALALLDARRLGAGALALEAPDGATAGLKPPTILRLLSEDDAGPPFAIIRAGAYEERYIRAQLTRTMLFVCTGNTCRSPMAVAIARDLLAREGEADPAVATRVDSAGVATMGGAPVSLEAVEALARQGVSLDPRRRSKGLTRDLIASADVIFAMSHSHADAVRALDPTAGERVQLLDPEGGEVPDPVGSPQAVYDDTARRLRDLIARRLREPWP